MVEVKSNRVGCPGAFVNTENTMFIAMGAFNLCRSKRDEEKHIGFSASESATHKHYDEIKREDIIGIGASYELIGRFSSVINYHELDKETIDKIIDEILVAEGGQLGSRITINDEMRAFLHKNANSQYGCRLLRSALHDRAMKVYVDMLTSGVEPSSCTIVMEDTDKVFFCPDRNAG